MSAMMLSVIARSFAKVSFLNLFSSSFILAAFAACSGSGMRRTEELFNIAGDTVATVCYLSGPNPNAFRNKPGLLRRIKWEPALSNCMLAIKGTVVGLYFHPGFVCPAPIPPYYFYAFWIDPPVPALLIEYAVPSGEDPTG